eukprot:TRINITY_DN991_c0_g2_i1.p1 TRINITY_DN991_c0_g2~~TRINITY_DN991_c0_g2_i1.p1  ORF type:complete len:541 (-),score=79.56 TRINITY_DN991_c0_g2_i1:134-1756(-)
MPASPRRDASRDRSPTSRTMDAQFGPVLASVERLDVSIDASVPKPRRKTRISMFTRFPASRITRTVPIVLVIMCVVAATVAIDRADRPTCSLDSMPVDLRSHGQQVSAQPSFEEFDDVDVSAFTKSSNDSDAGSRLAGIRCPVGYIPEVVVRGLVCRAADMGWVCPFGFRRVSAPLYCRRLRKPSFTEACGGPAMPPGQRLAVFVRTYRGDIRWLPTLLRSVCRFGPGTVSAVVVTYPAADEDTVGPLLDASFPWAISTPSTAAASFAEAVFAPPSPTAAAWRQTRFNATSARDIIAHGCRVCNPDYAAQMYDKVQPDVFLEQARETFSTEAAERNGLPADFVMHLDSDVLLVRPLRSSDVFNGGRPRLERRAWGPREEEMWAESTAAALAVPVESAPARYDYMLRIGNVYPTALYRRMRHTIARLHKLPETDAGAQEWFMQRAADHLGRPATEFEVLGHYAWVYERDAFAWTTCEPTDHMCAAYFPLIQAWSWGGFSAGVQAVYECVLQGRASLETCQRLQEAIDGPSATHRASARVVS